MSSENYESFSHQLAKMYDDSGLPAAILDSHFLILWCSRTAMEYAPFLKKADGILQLLPSRDISLIKESIQNNGSFTSDGSWNLFSGNAVIFTALPDSLSELYLAQPAFTPRQGTGMRPEGISRTLSSFGSQYRTSLNVIFSALSVLSRASLPSAPEGSLENAQQYLEAANQSAFQLLRSCEWISAYTALSTGAYPLKFTRVDLFAALREIFAASAALLEPTGIPLTYEIPDGVLIACVDMQKVSLAVLNLISNAARFTRAGNIVSIRLRKNARSVSVSVSDQGLGIPAEVIPRVFEPYFSYDHEGRPFAGNGLGLAIVRDAVRAMGGAVTMTSVENEGTTVSFTLPVSDNEQMPPVVESTAADYLEDRFSTLHIALADCIPCPM